MFTDLVSDLLNESAERINAQQKIEDDEYCLNEEDSEIIAKFEGLDELNVVDDLEEVIIEGESDLTHADMYDDEHDLDLDDESLPAATESEEDEGFSFLAEALRLDQEKLEKEIIDTFEPFVLEGETTEKEFSFLEMSDDDDYEDGAANLDDGDEDDFSGIDTDGDGDGDYNEADEYESDADEGDEGYDDEDDY